VLKCTKCSSHWHCVMRTALLW